MRLFNNPLAVLPDSIVHRIRRKLVTVRPTHRAQLNPRLREVRLISKLLKYRSVHLPIVKKSLHIHLTGRSVYKAHAQPKILLRRHRPDTPGNRMPNRRFYLSGSIA